MNQSDVVILVIKLILGGVAAFLAIMLWSRTRDIAWMCLVGGTITSYAGIVYDMLNSFGILAHQGLLLGSVSIAAILFASIPSLFYIAAFILMVLRTR